jgi:glycosyltransferase involved in cell wall biosynthesis
VVATDIRGSREEVVPDETGVLVPTRNVAALAHALEMFVSDPERGRRMGWAGRERALDLYDERRVVARQIEIIGTLCSPAQARVSERMSRPARTIG